ncbi:MAG: outer membrane protein assembly factor BamD [Bryobacterales bacterium]|nr:outer membrane protein assembly factor BamD [Bryobacterales bacterium]
MFLRGILLATIVFSTASWAGTKEQLQELQRDVGMLRDDLRNLQQTVAEMKLLLQQSVDTTHKVNTAVAVLDNSMRDRLREQEKIVAVPVANMGAKVDQMATEFQGLKESVTDVTARMGKLQQQIVDLGNTIKVMQAPPPPPSEGSAAAGTPQIPAETLYTNAMRDKSSGRMELAAQQFQEYLKFYGDTELAPNAQFYLGEIHYAQADFENALREFDLVLEKYPENNKTADAWYMKGQTLVKMGRRTDGAKEYRALISRFPNSDVAGKARSALRSMGLSATPAAPKRRTR